MKGYMQLTYFLQWHGLEEPFLSTGGSVLEYSVWSAKTSDDLKLCCSM
jgi:hypothetical protein